MNWVELRQGCMSIGSDGRLLWIPVEAGAHTINLGKMQVWLEIVLLYNHNKAKLFVWFALKHLSSVLFTYILSP